MKILHTADWHLGKRLDSFSRLAEQIEVMAEICQIADAEAVDAVIVAGDLFDQYNPSADAVELYYKTLKRLSNFGQRPIVAIAGNHDSPDRIEAPDPLARACGILFAGYPNSEIPEFRLETGIEVINSVPGFVELKLPKHEFPLRLILTPYANEYRLKTFFGVEDEEDELRQFLQKHWETLAEKYCDDKGVNLLVAHLFVGKEGEKLVDEPDDEKPILHVGGAQAIWSNNFPKGIQYAALGHLHRYQVVDNQPCPIVYSSSPLSYSFAEAKQKKYVVIIEAQPAQEVKFERIELKKGKRLMRERFDNIDTAIRWLNDNPDTLVELTIATEQYLSSVDRKRLLEAHEGIVTIIPELTGGINSAKTSSIDLSQNMETLFGQYFQYRYGQEPGDEFHELFKEIRAESQKP
ncbi:MAG: exonuclease subunit SbcD [Bacteroidota bacterium]